jgi:hypothetical protein
MKYLVLFSILFSLTLSAQVEEGKFLLKQKLGAGEGFADVPVTISTRAITFLSQGVFYANEAPDFTFGTQGIVPDEDGANVNAIIYPINPFRSFAESRRGGITWTSLGAKQIDYVIQTPIYDDSVDVSVVLNLPTASGTFARLSDITPGQLAQASATTGQVLSWSGTAWAPGIILRSGSGDPENTVTAPVGSLYTRTDGGAGTTLYVKESGTGNTGWVAK